MREGRRDGEIREGRDWRARKERGDERDRCCPLVRIPAGAHDR